MQGSTCKAIKYQRADLVKQEAKNGKYKKSIITMVQKKVINAVVLQQLMTREECGERGGGDVNDINEIENINPLARHIIIK